MKNIFTLLLMVSMVVAIAGCNSPSSGANENSSSGGNSESGGDESGGEAFYAGETLEIIVPFSAGGGTDTLFRFLQPYLKEYVEGNPTIQVVNIPGGGSIIGANEYVDLRDPNGLTALATSASTTIPYLIGQPEVHYNLQELQPIIGMPNGVVLYTSPDSGVKKGKDLLDPPKKLVLGATSPTGIDVMTLLAFEVLGVKDKVEIIFGYEGAGASRAAFLQGETNLDYQSGTSYQANVTPLVEEGKAVPLFSYGFTDENGDIVRDPAFPDIPTVKEVYVNMHGEEPSGKAWEAYKAFVGVVNGLHKTLWVHADAPQEAVDALREGAVKSIQDAKFKEEGGEILGGYTPVVGDELQASIKALVNIEEDTLKWVSNYLKEEYAVKGLE